MKGYYTFPKHQDWSLTIRCTLISYLGHEMVSSIANTIISTLYYSFVCIHLIGFKNRNQIQIVFDINYLFAQS